MIWNLTYQFPSKQPVTEEWISESGWTEAAIIADFYHRFPDATVISVSPMEVPA
jgi:hypothetical protein